MNKSKSLDLRVVYVWGFSALVTVVWSMSEIGQLKSGLEIEIMLISRLVLSLSAFLISAWSLRGRRVPRLTLSLFFLLVLVHEGLRTWFFTENLNHPAIGASLAFLAMALSFAGEREEWLVYFLPLGSIMLLSGVWQAERMLVPSALALVRLAFWPVSAILAGQLIVWTKAMKVASQSTHAQLSHLGMRQKHLLLAMRELRRNLQKPIQTTAIEQKNIPGDLRGTRMLNIDINAIRNSVHRYPTLEGISVFQICAQIMEKKQFQYAALKGVTFVLSRPHELSIPVIMAFSQETFAGFLDQLIDQAVDALGGGHGLIRLTYRLGVREVYLSLEDNGRGMNEELLQRSKVLGQNKKPHLTYQQIREEAAKWGTRFDVHARLGVGTRITFEFPRMDAFRPQLSNANLSAMTQPLSNSSPVVSAHL